MGILEWVGWVYGAGFVVQTLTNWIWLIAAARHRPVDSPADYMFIAVFWPLAILGVWSAPGRIGVHDGIEE